MHMARLVLGHSFDYFLHSFLAVLLVVVPDHIASAPCLMCCSAGFDFLSIELGYLWIAATMCLWIDVVQRFGQELPSFCELVMDSEKRSRCSEQVFVIRVECQKAVSQTVRISVGKGNVVSFESHSLHQILKTLSESFKHAGFSEAKEATPSISSCLDISELKILKSNKDGPSILNWSNPRVMWYAKRKAFSGLFVNRIENYQHGRLGLQEMNGEEKKLRTVKV